MKLSKDCSLQTVTFQFDRIVPKAPRGVLGNFIQCKVRQYVEPTREGTPKGQSVGLSRQKYHAALLSYLTALDLRQISRELRVSYPLLRKWRTEDSFDTVGYDAAMEFVNGQGKYDGEFDATARQVLRLVCGLGDKITSTVGDAEAIAKQIEEEKFLGFDDAALYGTTLLSIIGDEHHRRFQSLLKTLMALQPNQKPDEKTFDIAGDVLGWAYCLDRIERLRNVTAKKRDQESFVRHRRRIQSLVNLLITSALGRRPIDRSVQDLALYSSVILHSLLKD